LQGSVGLRAELPVFHYLKERLLLRWSDESRPAGGILPECGYFPGETLARGGVLQCRIGLASIRRSFGLE